MVVNVDNQRALVLAKNPIAQNISTSNIITPRDWPSREDRSGLLAYEGNIGVSPYKALPRGHEFHAHGIGHFNLLLSLD